MRPSIFVINTPPPPPKKKTGEKGAKVKYNLSRAFETALDDKVLFFIGFTSDCYIRFSTKL